MSRELKKSIVIEGDDYEFHLYNGPIPKRFDLSEFHGDLDLLEISARSLRILESYVSMPALEADIHTDCEKRQEFFDRHTDMQFLDGWNRMDLLRIQLTLYVAYCLQIISPQRKAEAIEKKIDEYDEEWSDVYEQERLLEKAEAVTQLALDILNLFAAQENENSG